MAGTPQFLLARRVRIALAAACAVTLPATAQAPADVRIALVIGNAAYAGAAALQNPTNDSGAMAAALKQLGFQVTELRDASRAQMADALAVARDALRGKQGVALFYFAGHGMQLDWRNYMLPVDAQPRAAADVQAQALDADAVLGAFRSAATRMNIVVLDACRDNPFGRAGAGKGLAQMDAPPGTFIAYATAPGNVADDGAGSNSLYTGYLVQELQRPQARIEDVFKRVRMQVRQASQGRQVPWESTSLEEDFYFARVASRPEPEPAQQAFAREKADWDRIADSRKPDDFYDYLKKYPNGSISEHAQAVLQRLEADRIVRVPDKDGMVQVPARLRLQPGDVRTAVVRDQYSGREVRRARQRVVSVTEDKVTMDRGDAAYTPEGGVIDSGGGMGRYDPPRLDLPAGDYVVGKKWSYRSLQTGNRGTPWSLMVSGTVRIVGVEEVTVPAGTFKTFKLELVETRADGVTMRLTRWMRPDWAFPVKQLREVRYRSGAPDLEVMEMQVPQRRD